MDKMSELRMRRARAAMLSESIYAEQGSLDHGQAFVRGLLCGLVYSGLSLHEAMRTIVRSSDIDCRSFPRDLLADYYEAELSLQWEAKEALDNVQHMEVPY